MSNDRLSKQVNFGDGDEEDFFDEQEDLHTNEIDNENPEPRCACLLLLDTSGSMSGQPIVELNKGLRAFHDSLLEDEVAALRVEPAIVTFGGSPQVAQDFATADTFHPPTLHARGGTPMGAAILKGIEMIKARKDIYKQHDIEDFRPWLFLITDGAPTDTWQTAAAAIKQGEAAKEFLFFAVGTQGADFNTLRQLSDRVPPLQLQGLKFGELFEWLSKSMKSVSRSSLDAESVQHADTSGWASTPVK